MSMKDGAPNIKPLDGKKGAGGMSDAQLHSEDARNNPGRSQELGGNNSGHLAGKPPGGKR